MKDKHPDLTWTFLDACNLPYESGSFSAVIEKGTMDALLRGGDESWHKMCEETLRVLKPGGCFLQITDENPELRLPLLELLVGWQVSFREVESDSAYESFIYKCVKKSH